MRDRSMRSGTKLTREIQLNYWSTAGNLSNWSSGVQIPRNICTRFGRYLYSTRCSWIIKLLNDVRAHCYCVSLVRTLFIGHARATSFSSARTESKTQQNIELMTFALTWCANIFVGCSVTPTFFFGRSLPFLTLSIILKKQKKHLCMGSFNYFSYTIKMGSNWYMDTVVRDLEVAFFKANSS